MLFHLLVSALPWSLPHSRGCLRNRAFPTSRGGITPLLTPPCFLRPQLLCRPSTWTCGVQPESLDRAASATSCCARFQQDLLILRLHSDRGERCIGFVMEVARSSIVHALAPHFLWLFAVRYATQQLNLWPHVSYLETSPILLWRGEVGDASEFRFWGSLALVRDPSAGKLSPRTLRCVFLGFFHLLLLSPPPPFSPVLLSPLLLVPDPLPVTPLPSPGPAPSGVSIVDPPPLVAPSKVSSDTSGQTKGGDPAADDTAATRHSPRLATPPGGRLTAFATSRCGSGAAGGGDTGGADSRGVGSSGVRCPNGGRVVATPGGASGSGCQQQPSRQETLSPRQLRKWAVQWGSLGGRAGGPSVGGTGAGGAGAGGAGAGGWCWSPSGLAGGAGAGGAGTAAAGGASVGGAGARGAGAGGAGDVGAGDNGAGDAGSRGAGAGGALGT
ncbi:unnamed protein product [Closterium sp. NIES-53]